MFEFKKKETLIENIAFMSLMGAINLIITLLMTFIPLIVAITLIFLPLTSVLVTIYCKKKYFIFYFITTVGLCLLITMYNITDTLFFVIPSLVSGFLFGILMERSIHAIYLILVPALINLGFTYLSVPFIELIYGVNFIKTIANIFSLGDFKYLDVLAPSFILLFCIIQSLFSYMVIKEELKKFFINHKNEDNEIINLIIILITLVSVLVSSFFYIPLAYIFLILSIFISCYLFINQLFTKNKVLIILNCSTLVITFFSFAICYEYVESVKSLLLLSIFPFLTSLYYLVNFIYIRAHKFVK